MNPIKMFCDRSGFVGLNGANEMPVNRPVALGLVNHGYFLERLLQVVLTKMALIVVQCFDDHCCGFSLTHCKKFDFSGITGKALTGLRDPLSDAGEITLY